MHLYHLPGSRSNRVLWILEEAGAPYDVTVVTRDERSAPAYLARHPLGRSPVAELAEGPVFESAALCLQVADANPAAGLIAAPGSHDRALTYQWAFFAMTEMEAGILQKYLNKDSDPARAAAGVESYRKVAQVIENALAGKQFLVGNRFSVADVIVGSTLDFAQFLEMNDGFPNIAAYIERLHARPAYGKANA